MGEIHFFSEEIEFSLDREHEIKAWISEVIAGENKQLLEVNYIFCNDEYLHKINVAYLDHDTLTDIITFDNSDVTEEIEGDIYISIERVRENASAFGVDFDDEMHRVLVHGVLHLTGYNDKSELEIQQMRKKEEACLSLRKL